MHFSWFSVAIILISAVIAFFEIRRGYRFGLRGSLVSLASLALSLTVSLALAPGAAELAIDPVFDWASEQPFYRSIVENYGAIDSFARLCVCVVVSSILFVVLLFVWRAIISLVARFAIGYALETSDRVNGKSRQSACAQSDRFAGAVVGAVCAVILAMAITSPFMGVLDVLDRSVEIAARADDTSLDLLGISDGDRESLERYADDIPGNILYRFGGEYMFYTVAATSLEGERVYVYRVLDNIEAVAEGFVIDFSNIAELAK